MGSMELSSLYGVSVLRPAWNCRVIYYPASAWNRFTEFATEIALTVVVPAILVAVAITAASFSYGK